MAAKFKRNGKHIVIQQYLDETGKMRKSGIPLKVKKKCCWLFQK